MFRGRGHIGSWVSLIVLVSGPAGSVSGQDADRLKELNKLHDEVADFARLIKVEEAEAAIDKLDEWQEWGGKLTGSSKTTYLRAQAIVACALGDAKTANELITKLPPTVEADATTLQTLYLIGVVTGNGLLLDEVLKKMKEGADDKQQKVVQLRQRRLRKVGQEAPDLSAKTEELGDVDLRKRNGEALLLDLWNLRTKPSDANLKAMKSLYEDYKGHRVQFLGINTDGPAKVEEARKFVDEQKLEWPQHYELKSADAPITAKGLQAGTPPWVVLIDREGRIRAVGDPSEPAFVYVVRAVADETEKMGLYTKPIPVTPEKSTGKKGADGAAPEAGAKEAETKPGDKPADKPAEPKEEKKVKGKGDLPSVPEAESKLKQARVYLKTGKRTDAKKLLQEIIKDYPDSREAREAQQILASLP